MVMLTRRHSPWAVSVGLSVFALVASLGTATSAFAEDVDATPMLARLNEIRAEHGAGPLVRDEGLDRMAAAHCADMSQNNFFDHVSPTHGNPSERAAALHLDVVRVGENIAIHRSVGEAQTALEASEGHLHNMLDPDFARVGLAAVSGERGVYVTQVFARFRELQPQVADSAPAAVVAPAISGAAFVSGPPPSQSASAPAIVSQASPLTVQAAPVPQQPTYVIAASQGTGPAPQVTATGQGTAVQVQNDSSARLQPVMQNGVVIGYWVASGGRWWWATLPPNAPPGSMLQVQMVQPAQPAVTQSYYPVGMTPIPYYAPPPVAYFGFRPPVFAPYYWNRPVFGGGVGFRAGFGGFGFHGGFHGGFRH